MVMPRNVQEVSYTGCHLGLRISIYEKKTQKLKTAVLSGALNMKLFLSIGHIGELSYLLKILDSRKWRVRSPYPKLILQ